MPPSPFLLPPHHHPPKHAHQGLWGMLLMLLLVFPLAAALPGNDYGGCTENVWDALAMVHNSRPLQLVLVAFFVSVRFIVNKHFLYCDKRYARPCLTAGSLLSGLIPCALCRRTMPALGSLVS